MHCPILLVADGFNLNPDGTINVHRIINQINAKLFPVNLKGLPLLVRVVADPAEYNAEYQLRLEFVDEDGGLVSSLSYDKTVPKDARRRLINVDQIAGLPDTLVKKAGSYQLTALINNEIKAIYPLEVIKA